MLFLPIRVDAPQRHRPVVNYALIAINVAMFLFIRYGSGPVGGQIESALMLNVAHPKLYQFFTYAFLHGDWAHLIGNMLFLYIFGNSINDKLGNLGYTLFYAASAIFSGAGYALWTSSPMPLVGASGAIAAVTTAFLVLYPRSNVLVLIWIFYFIDTIEFSSLFLIVFKMILLDNIIFPALSGPGNVAHGAHLVGYLFGAMVPLILLITRALDRDQFDVLALWARMHRRHQYTRVVEVGRSPFGEAIPTARPVETVVVDETSPSYTALPSAKAAELRNAISEALSRYDLATAAERYRQLVEAEPRQVLARRDQLDIANQLMSTQNYTAAAEAYEKYLSHYPSSDQVEQVQLLLGIIYSRYLPNPERARDLLRRAKAALRDANQVAICEEELKRVGEDAP